METQTTKIDTVRLVRQIRDAHHEELKEASREERIAFFNSKVRTSPTGTTSVREPAA